MHTVKYPRGFHGRPRTDWLEDGRLMVLVEDFHYTCSAGVTYSARQGLQTDGKSTPRFFWAGFIGGPPYVGQDRYAALIHDQQCADARAFFVSGMEIAPGRRAEWLHNARGMRQCADRIFLEMLEYSGVRLVKRRAMFRAVRLHAAWEFRNMGAALVPLSEAEKSSRRFSARCSRVLRGSG
jgi:hypothetical protein